MPYGLIELLISSSQDGKEPSCEPSLGPWHFAALIIAYRKLKQVHKGLLYYTPGVCSFYKVRAALQGS